MGLIDRLRRTFTKPAVIGNGVIAPAYLSTCAVTIHPVNPNGIEAANAIERLRGYVRHDKKCASSMFSGKEPCRCGLTALLKELTDE